MNYELVFEIEPQSKERPRFSNHGGKMRTYTAIKTRKYESTIAVMARKQMLTKPILSGSLVAHVVFEFLKPKKTMLSSPKKDLDNLCKALFDALNEIVYHDDTQICGLVAHKRWGTENKIRLLIGQEGEL